MKVKSDFFFCVEVFKSFKLIKKRIFSCNPNRSSCQFAGRSVLVGTYVGTVPDPERIPGNRDFLKFKSNFK